MGWESSGWGCSEVGRADSSGRVGSRVGVTRDSEEVSVGAGGGGMIESLDEGSEVVAAADGGGMIVWAVGGAGGGCEELGFAGGAGRAR